MKSIYVSQLKWAHTVFSTGPSSSRILQETGREMEEDSVLTIYVSRSIRT